MKIETMGMILSCPSLNLYIKGGIKMLGYNPGCFKKLEAAKLAGKAFALEEERNWIVIQKWGIYDESYEQKPSEYYSLCPRVDLYLAEKENYRIVCDCD